MRHRLPPSRRQRRSPLLFVALAALPVAFADVKFTSPAPGAVLPVGELNVAWVESGKQPYIQELSGYTLNLMVGGNSPLDVSNSIAIYTLVSGGTFINSSVSANIPATLSATVTNGFYLSMICTDRNGGELIDYSDRFTLTGMTGTVAGSVLDAAKDLNGNPAGPKRGGNAQALFSDKPSTQVSTSTNSLPKTQLVTVTSPAASSSHPQQSTYPAYHKSLSMGTIVGIVVGCLVGASAVLGAIIFLLRRRRRRKVRDGVIDNVDPSVFGQHKPPQASWKQPSVTTLSELSADGRVMEMGDGLPPAEMDSMNIRAELEGDSAPLPTPHHANREGSVSSSLYEQPQTPLTPVSPSVYDETLLTPRDYLGSPVTPVSRL